MRSLNHQVEGGEKPFYSTDTKKARIGEEWDKGYKKVKKKGWKDLRDSQKMKKK